MKKFIKWLYEKPQHVFGSRIDKDPSNAWFECKEVKKEKQTEKETLYTVRMLITKNTVTNQIIETLT